MAALIVGVLASGAQAQIDESAGTASSSQESSVLNSYIVTFSAGTSDSAARELLSSVYATVDSRIAPLRMYSVTLPSALAAATLEADASVSRVDEDHERGVATTPNDPRFSDQWALPRSAGRPRDAVTPTGSATVADPRHRRRCLPPRPRREPRRRHVDPRRPSCDERPERPRHADGGHRRRETDNGDGIAGVGYAGVKVMPVTVLGADGTGQDATSSRASSGPPITAPTSS